MTSQFYIAESLLGRACQGTKLGLLLADGSRLPACHH